MMFLFQKAEQIRTSSRDFLIDSRPVSTVLSKSVQTDIQNIRNKLVSDIFIFYEHLFI